MKDILDLIGNHWCFRTCITPLGLSVVIIVTDILKKQHTILTLVHVGL